LKAKRDAVACLVLLVNQVSPPPPTLCLFEIFQLPTGARGERGAEGRTGAPGQDGANGLQGNPGINGLPGHDGKVQLLQVNSPPPFHC